MQSGTVELRSGRWSWELARPETRAGAPITGSRKESLTRSETSAGPYLDEDPADLRLVLRAPDHPGARMSRGLSAPAGELAEEEVRALARKPDRRILPTDDGDLWTFRPVAPPDPVEKPGEEFERPPRKVRFSREGEPPRVAPVPGDRPLGEATRDELLDLLSDR